MHKIDKDAKPIKDEANNYELVNFFKKIGYKHQKLNLYFENMQPRFTFRVDLDKSIDEVRSNYSKSVNISNPSFFMVIEIIKKCKNAKVKFNNWKWYIISSILFTLFCILLCVFGLSGN